MEVLKISDDLKRGKEEILLDPSKKGLRCGLEFNPLLLNDIYGKWGATYMVATEYIDFQLNNIASGGLSSQPIYITYD